MTLPDIPDEAIDAAVRAYDTFGNDIPDALAAAWPHLYAAALRHAADGLEGSLGVAGKPQDPYEFRAYLRRLADEATR